MTTKAQALAYFEQMGFPAFFQRLYAGEYAKDDITILVGCPEEYFLMTDAEQAAYSQGVLMPVIADADFSTMVFHHPQQQCFIELFTEDGAVRQEYANYRQLMFAIFCRAYDCFEDEPEAVVNICQQFQLTASETQHWLQFLTTDNSANYDEFEAAKAAFMASIIE
ncbi:hypothetical protein L9G74_04635 [Shewanella sp. C32]|uniref:Uncharacterized protein n=1 Tax=Shewanella electrica TaxID=515560 RepID=A0ABT2FHA6_9GAMM|nr:hypothetical protein [Shewanella electrica]MCH1923619.1 hypothetical protein [Shewanella electrica]MCS4555715.1 hypothetical protein [Shewanella electrica]